MAVRLTKTKSDSQLENMTEVINVTIDVLNSLDIGKHLIDFSLSKQANGGSFSATVVDKQYVDQQVINVMNRLGDSYTGVIDKLIKSYTRSGKLTKISGSLIIAAIRYTIKATFENADPFLLGGQIVPEALANTRMTEILYEYYYRLFGMSARIVMLQLGAISGIPVVIHSMPFDYPVWKYVVQRNRVYDSIDELAKWAGCNAVIRDNSIYIVAWDSYVRELSYDFAATINGVEVTYEKSEFDVVSVSSASEMTPWNSTFSGPAEQITVLNFEAGTQSLTDISASTGITKKQDGWYYPKTPSNKWVTFTSTSFASNLFEGFGSGVWDIERKGEKLSYSAYIVSLLSLNKYPTITALNGGFIENVFDVLFRWNTAVYKFTPGSDVYPYLYVVPGEAPKFISNFNFEDKNFSTELIGVQPFPTADVDSDTPFISGITSPSGWAVPVYNSDSLGIVGYAADGSGYIGLKPKIAKVPDVPNYQPVINESSLIRIPDDKIKVKVLSKTIVVPADTSNSVVLNAANSSVLLGAAVGINLDADPASTSGVVSTGLEVTDDKYRRVIVTALETEKKDRKVTLQNLYKVITGKGYSILCVPTEHDGFKTSEIHNATIDTKDYIQMVLFIKKPFAVPHEGTLLLSTPKSSDSQKDRSITEITSMIGQYSFVSDSGRVDQRSYPLKGQWTLYGLKRKTYPCQAICNIAPDSTPDFLFNNVPYTIKGKNIKEVSGSMITDYFSANMYTTHLGKFTTYLAKFLAQDFVSFSFQIVDRNDPIPEIADKVTLRGVPDIGDIEGKVTGVSVSIGAQGSLITVQCGRLPIP